MRFNRFVFLNRPVLSLETHLGVTASPQAPFPADFVTPPVFGRSPPLRLTPSRSRRRACSLLQHQLRRALHSKHAQATPPPAGRASLIGRTVGDICRPRLIGCGRGKVSIEQVRCHRQPMFRIRRGFVAPLVARPNAVLTHEPFDPRLAGRKSARPKLTHHARRAVGAFEFLVNGPEGWRQHHFVYVGGMRC